MTKTLIDLDDEALAEAAKSLGTSSKKDTVNAALREIVDRRRRAAAVARMRAMVAEGEIDFSVLDQGERESDDRQGALQRGAANLIGIGISVEHRLTPPTAQDRLGLATSSPHREAAAVRRRARVSPDTGRGSAAAGGAADAGLGGREDHQALDGDALPASRADPIGAIA